MSKERILEKWVYKAQGLCLPTQAQVALAESA